MAHFPIKLLAIDDQKIVYKAIEGLVKDEQNIFLKTVSQPNCALQIAEEFAPTVILLDLTMPEIDGLLLLRYFRENPKLKEVPVIVLSAEEQAKTKAQAFARGACDYMVKFPEKEEFVARIKYHSTAYCRLLERNETQLELMQSEQRLKKELSAAAKYIHSQLPQPIEDRLSVSWKYLPSIELGGDAFGYSFIDKDHFMFYIIDVAGHGVKAALHSVSIMHAIHRMQAVQAKELLKPKALLTLLNREFPMEKHDNAFATLWYGVLQLKTKKLTYAGAGAPPVVLLPSCTELPSEGVPLGISQDALYEEKSLTLKEKELVLFTDGLWELEKEDGAFISYDEFKRVLKQPEVPGVSTINRLIHWAEHVRNEKPFQDDVCLVHIKL